MTIINDIKIKNPTAELILQKFSKEEISELFSTFLILMSKENKIEHKKTRWAEFSDKRQISIATLKKTIQTTQAIEGYKEVNNKTIQKIDLI